MYQPEYYDFSGEEGKRIKEDLENLGLNHVTISNLPEDFFRMSKRQLEKFFEYASDAFIAKMYDIPQQQIKKRRDDFGITQLMNTLNQLEIEEACMPIFKGSSKIMSNQYNNGNTTHTNSTPINSEKEFLYMKATEKVRRIDDLGRVVIPKEIRRTFRIREGEPLEIFIAGAGEIMFKKYSPIGEISTCASAYADVLAKAGDMPVIVCDKDHVVAAAGISKKEVLDRRVSHELEELMELRQPINAEEGEKHQVFPIEGFSRTATAGAPVIVAGDVVGYIAALPENKRVNESFAQTIRVTAQLLARQLEE